MKWLEELNENRLFRYRCTSHEDVDDVLGTPAQLKELFEQDVECEPREEIVVNTDEGDFKFVYAGFEPTRVGLMSRITFEKNGRVGLRTTFGDGKQSVRSMTKEKAFQGKGTDSVLTKGCQEASNKEKQKQVVQKWNSAKNQAEKQAHMMKQARKGRL